MIGYHLEDIQAFMVKKAYEKADNYQADVYYDVDFLKRNLDYPVFGKDFIWFIRDYGTHFLYVDDILLNGTVSNVVLTYHPQEDIRQSFFLKIEDDNSISISEIDLVKFRDSLHYFDVDKGRTTTYLKDGQEIITGDFYDLSEEQQKNFAYFKSRTNEYNENDYKDELNKVFQTLEKAKQISIDDYIDKEREPELER